MNIIYTLDVLSAAPSGGVPLQDLGIITNVPKWSDAPTNTILTTNYNITNLGVKHEEVQISEMLNFAITSGHIKLYGNGIEIPDNSASLVFSGNASQYIRGDGSLGNFPTSFGTGGGGVSYYLNGNIASDVATYYEMSKIAALSPNADFSKVGDGLITQFITPSGEPNIVSIPGGNWSCGIYASMSAMGGTPAIYLELLKYDGSNFTSIAISSNKVITGGTSLDLYSLAIPVPETTLAISDRLVIRIYIVNSEGKTVTIYTQDQHLSEIKTTLPTGISGINNLISSTQYFTTGTTGSNFTISSSGETHTFNLPVASATNTGKLSSTDWSTFNNKGSGSVTQVSVVTANGLAGTVATDTTTPAITLTTSITGVLKGNGTAISPATPGTDYVAPNVAITGATKTKITYDSKGLVTAGTDATTADIADSTNKRYVTDAQLTVLSNTSGTNTGDQTTISGNAGTATALQTARTINGVSFDGTTNITVTAAAGTLSGTTLASGVTSSSLTSVGTLTNLTVTNPISGSVTGNAATVTTNANLSGPIASVGNVTSITSQTGTGSTFVMSNSPTLVTPALGTPSSGVATNLTGTASGLTSGNVITNANLTGPVTSVGNATSVTPNAITNAMLAQVPTATFKARATAGTGDVENLTVAQTKTLLDLTGTNSGDQTITLTSDVTGSGTGSFATTIAADAVTNTKLANMATSTFKGRITAGTGDPEDLSSTQATSLLNNFVGDSGSGGTKGLVPAPGIGDATKYLKGDGTWATVAGGGSGTVTSVSVVSANGLTGTVATPTTTPAITLATSVTGVLKGNGTAISAASAGTDYVAPNAAITGSTNTKITYDSKGLVTSGTSAVLASADFANQGTTTTVLHGNASGDPSFGAVSLTTDVSGILPIANGGTNSSATLNNNRHIVSSGGALVETAAATNGQLLIGSTGAAPVLATITDGYGHSTTNGAGTITHAVSLTTTHIDGTTTLTTTSATDVALSSSITGTPAAGTYLLMFSCSMGANTNTAASTTISLYTGASLGTATQVTGTERSVKNGSGNQGASVTGSVSFQVPVTFTGTSVYEIRWRRSAGTSSIFHRQLTLLRIA